MAQATVCNQLILPGGGPRISQPITIQLNSPGFIDSGHAEVIGRLPRMLDRAASDQLILAHRPIVHAIVRDTLPRLPRHIRSDDLTSAGLLGLVEAARSFDDTRGVPFARWAAVRIKGAIGDELRVNDPRVGPRLTKGEAPLRLDSLPPWAVDALAPDRGLAVEDRALANIETAHLRRAVTALPAHLRTVVHAAFGSDRTHREAAAAAGVPAGDFYHLRSEVIRALRDKMGVPAPAGERRIPLPRRLAHLAA